MEAIQAVDYATLVTQAHEDAGSGKAYFFARKDGNFFIGKVQGCSYKNGYINIKPHMAFVKEQNQWKKTSNGALGGNMEKTPASFVECSMQPGLMYRLNVEQGISLSILKTREALASEMARSGLHMGVPASL